MLKINIVIADPDRAYIGRLVNYLTEKNKQLNISSFTEKESFIKYLLSDSTKVQVILFDEDMICEELDKKRCDLKLLMSNGVFDSSDKYKSINKYQRADDFLNEILIEFSEVTGHTEALSSDNVGKTKAVVVYSPVGGSGKTTLALSLAKALSEKGKNILFLNFEDVCSVKSILSGVTNHSMSEVYLAAKTKNANSGIKIIQCCETHTETGISYVNPPECAAEYSEMSPEELKMIVDETKNLKKFDLIIIDMSSGYNEAFFKIASECSVIVMPYLNSRLSLNKMQMFADELNKLDRLEYISDKLLLVENISKVKSIDDIGGIPVRMCIEESVMLKNTDNLLYSSTINSVKMLADLID